MSEAGAWGERPATRAGDRHQHS